MVFCDDLSTPQNFPKITSSLAFLSWCQKAATFKFDTGSRLGQRCFALNKSFRAQKQYGKNWCCSFEKLLLVPVPPRKKAGKNFSSLSQLEITYYFYFTLLYHEIPIHLVVNSVLFIVADCHLNSEDEEKRVEMMV